MRKSSLGRRNSNRPSTAAGRTSVDVSNARKSGIPVARQQRAHSTERQSISNMNRMQRAHSVHSLVGDLPPMTPARTPLSSRPYLPGGGTERPARTTSYGTPSVSFGSSCSLGGQKNKRDNRPLQDKEWQAKAIEFIEETIQRHPDGMNVMGDHLKPLSVAKFLDACDLLLKMLHPTVNITKVNYQKELPFLLQKKMQYKGKLEKSWMIVVSTNHAMPFALGLLEFLSQCVTIRYNVDIDSLMFPLRFDGSNSLAEINFQLLIPYYNSSFELLRANRPEYERRQLEMANEVMHKHYDQEDGLARKDAIVAELNKVQSDYDKINHDRNLIVQQTEALQNELRSIERSLKQDEEKIAQCKVVIPAKHTELSELNRYFADLNKTGQKFAEDLEHLQKKAQEQAITLRDVENIKKKRDSIDREIVSSQKYIKSYQDMIFSEDMEIVQLKNEIEELTRETNLKAMSYVPIEPQFEKLVLPTKLEEISLPLKEEDFEILNKRYGSLSLELKSTIAAAEKERDQVEKDMNDLKDLNNAKREQMKAHKLKSDAELEDLNNGKRAMEEQLDKAKFEVETLENQERTLISKIEAKRELVAKEKARLEEGEAVMLEGVRHLDQRFKTFIIERKRILQGVDGKNS